jgi:Fe-S cluster biogenesis protein NfuA
VVALKGVKQMNTEQNTLREKVEESLMAIRPSLQADGGDVELVNVDDEGVVSVRLVGACRGCPMSTMTLKMGIERTLREQIPEIKSVEAV